jgi:sec-independent protein translocase protein TatC
MDKESEASSSATIGAEAPPVGPLAPGDSPDYPAPDGIPTPALGVSPEPGSGVPPGSGPSAPVEPEPDEEEGGPIKTFLEHLEDLRWVLIRIVAALLVGMVACLAGAPAIVEFLRWPLLNSGALVNGQPIALQPLGPLGPFMITMKLALYGGITVALPFILYFVGDFLMPALKKHEKVFFLRAFIIGAGLFLLGMMVCYFFALPLTLKATVQYSGWMGFRPDFWRAEEYFNFVTLFMVLMGASFEVPVLVLGLVKLGVIQLEWLTKGRPYFFLITFTLVAFITPDFVSTFFLVIPLMILMEICIWIAWYWRRKEQRQRR